MHHIYLVGLRGSGKSTVARILGEQLEAEVIDGDGVTNDILNEQGHGSIGEVTAPVDGERNVRGWIIMREAEAEGVERICEAYDKKSLIWAPGGGTIVHGAEDLATLNRNRLCNWGMGFYLVPDPNDINYSTVELGFRVHSDNVAAIKSGNEENYRHPLFVDEIKDSHPLQVQIQDMIFAWRERHGKYSAAVDTIIYTKNLAPEEVAAEIISRYEVLV